MPYDPKILMVNKFQFAWYELSTHTTDLLSLRNLAVGWQSLRSAD